MTFDQSFQSTQYLPMNAKFIGLVNYQGLAWKTAFSYTGATRVTTIQSTKIIKDFPETNSRFLMGDLTYPVLSSQVDAPMFGLGFSHGFLIGESNYSPEVSQYQLSLPNDAKVQIYVNDQIVYDEPYSAGNYDLRNFPVQSGYNNVIVKVIETSGNTRYFQFPFAVNEALVKKGLQEFTYNIGFPFQSDTSARSGYPLLKRTLAFSGYHKFGVSSDYNFNVGFQSNRGRSILGVEQVLAQKSGLFRFQTLASMKTGEKTGYGATLSFGSFSTGTFLDSVGFGVTFLDAAYNPSDDPSNAGSQRFKTSLVLNTKTSELFTNTYQVSTEASLQGNHIDRYSMRHAYTFSNQLRGTLSFDTTVSTQSGWERSIEFGLSWDPDASVRTSFRATEKGAQSLQIGYTPRFVKGLATSALLSLSRSRADSTAELAYSCQDDARQNLDATLVYAEKSGVKSAALAGRYSGARFSANGSISPSGTGALTLGTAVVYADGYFGISRPVDSNFVIMHTNPTLSGATITYSPYGKTDFWGSPVIIGFQPYSKANVVVSDANLPFGTELGDGRFSFTAPDNGGTHFLVGKDRGYIARGTLLIEKTKTPLQGVLGQATRVSDGKKVDFFTNMSGEFQLVGVSAGTYQIRVEDAFVYIGSILIPDDQKGLISLGPVQMYKEVK